MDHGGDAARSTTELGMAGGASWQQQGPAPVDVAVLVGPLLSSGVVPVHDSNFYSALQPPRPGAEGGVVLAALLHGGLGAVYSGDYELQLRPGAGHGEVLVGEVFIDLPLGGGGGGGGGAAYDDYGYSAQQPRPGAGHGELHVDLLPDGVGHGVVYDGSGALADDLGAVYDNRRGMVTEHLRRLLPFAGIVVSSVAVNGLAADPGSPAVALYLFALLLGGLFLVILHVLRV